VRDWVRPIGLFAISAVLVCIAWAELETALGPVWNVVAIVALAFAPLLTTLLSRRWWVGLLVGIVALAPAASVALDVPLTDMQPGSRDFFGPVFSALGDGFRDVYETDAPFDRLDHPELAGIVLLGIYVFLAGVGLLLACRRSLLAGSLLVVGVALPVTVAASYGAGTPLTTGALVLAAILLTLFVTRTDRRPLRGLAQAAILGAALVAVAVGASTSGAIAKDAFVSWTRWDLYDRPKDPVGVRYVWTSNYRGIAFPDKETVVLTVKGPKRNLYWRATTLDDYTGVGWREDVEAVPTQGSGRARTPFRPGDPELPRAALDRKNWVRQDVSVVALADTHLVAASQPVRWLAGSQAPLEYASNGAVLAPRGLRIGTSYTVWSYAPQVSPRTLAKLPPDYPDSLERYLEVVPDVVFPAFGTADRDAAVDRIFRDRSFDVLLGEYAPLYEEARRVVGNAASPYIAAATLEAYFRTQGGFHYNEQPAQPIDSTPPLVDFVLRTKEGYCQHYAGAMAVMLRLLGVPARVAVGFTSGSYDQRRKEWTVTDHDAHAWVEVYFPGEGWLPFDPTPGRGQLSAAYSTASTSFPSGGPTALGVNADSLSEILKQRLAGVDPGDARGGESTPAGAPATGEEAESGGGIGVAGLVIIVLAVLVLGLLGLKELRRRARFLSRDPRHVAAACRRDLVAFLADQRIAVDDSTTLEELAASLEKTYRVDASAFVAAATAARFAPPDRAGEAAARARRELRTLLRGLRRALPPSSRARGAFSLRSLPV
jgi:transglutaminase-like putative cysteine protease